MATRDRTIGTMRELQRLVPSIVKEVNADDALALRAATNPLLALEELGYRLAPELRAEAERRVRFPRETRERLDALEKEIFAAAGERFDVDAPGELDRVLFHKLKLPRPEKSGFEQAERVAVARQASRQGEAAITSIFHRRFDDPLAPLADRHPIMKPLLAYRQLDASAPRLAPPELYERIRRNEVTLPVTRVRARLKNQKPEV